MVNVVGVCVEKVGGGWKASRARQTDASGASDLTGSFRAEISQDLKYFRRIRLVANFSFILLTGLSHNSFSVLMLNLGWLNAQLSRLEPVAILSSQH
jgi:hypothetical protein